MYLQVKGTPRVARSQKKLGRGKDGFSSRAIKESMNLPTPVFQTSSVQKCETINFSCLQYFVTADEEYQGKEICWNRS